MHMDISSSEIYRTQITIPFGVMTSVAKLKITMEVSWLRFEEAALSF